LNILCRSFYDSCVLLCMSKYNFRKVVLSFVHLWIETSDREAEWGRKHKTFLFLFWLLCIRILIVPVHLRVNVSPSSIVFDSFEVRLWCWARDVKCTNTCLCMAWSPCWDCCVLVDILQFCRFCIYVEIP
jgi:hypothetical protein